MFLKMKTNQLDYLPVEFEVKNVKENVQNAF